jgi:acetyl esterase/lipase
MYGTDQYITQYEAGDRAAVEGAGSLDQDLVPVLPRGPYHDADALHGGEKDFNVPITGSEQMYQALRSLGVDTQLVVYPNQFHGLTIPATARTGSNATWPGMRST